MPKIDDETTTPETAKPYETLGVVFDGVQSGQLVGQCPFCHKEGKFSMDPKTGEAHCWTCTINPNSEKGGVNATSFAYQVWLRSGPEKLNGSSHGVSEEGPVAELARERKLLGGLERWGVRINYLNGKIIVPGWNPGGKMTQLYRLVKWKKKGKVSYLLKPTPGLESYRETDGRVGMFMVEGETGLNGGSSGGGGSRPVVFCEGLWDAAALEEALGPSVDVIGLPGIYGFRPGWASAFRGREVLLAFDNDKAGQDGMQYTGRILLTNDKPPKQVNVVKWPKEFQSGGDVRDWLVTEPNLRARGRKATVLLSDCRQAPKEWADKSPRHAKMAELGTIQCEDWYDLQPHWEKAMRWRQDLSDVLAVMLAVAVSTEQTGDQLFLQLIGNAGSGKTRLCDAMLTSKHCYAIEHLTGFHSGWKADSKEDYSILARANRKTWVTPEGDVIMSNPNFERIMSEQRRIFDGTSGASYKTIKDDRKYTGLRTPWIIAGTHALLDKDQSKLGDRFLRVYLDVPGEDERRAILKRVIRNAARAVATPSEADAQQTVDGPMLEAYQRTGGFIDYLREVGSGDLVSIDVPEKLDDAFIAMGELVALTRWKADTHNRWDTEEDLEVHTDLPTRLTSQFVRLAMCLAIVLGEKSITPEVMRIVRKVAYDTARGRVLRNCKVLYEWQPTGITYRALALETGRGEDSEHTLLKKMKNVGLAEYKEVKTKRGKIRTSIRWFLTPHAEELWNYVILGEG